MSQLFKVFRVRPRLVPLYNHYNFLTTYLKDLKLSSIVNNTIFKVTIKKNLNILALGINEIGSNGLGQILTLTLFAI